MVDKSGNVSSPTSKWLGTSRLHELRESKFPFVSRIEFIRSQLSNFSAHVYGLILCGGVLSPGILTAEPIAERRVRRPSKTLNQGTITNFF